MSLKLPRLSLRFILPLALVLGLSAFFVVPLVDHLTVRWFVRDLDAHAQALANSLEDPLQEYVPLGEKKKIMQLFTKAIRDQRLYALAFCDAGGKILYKTPTYAETLGCPQPKDKAVSTPSLVRLPKGSLHLLSSTIATDDARLGTLVLVHDMSFIERRSDDTKRYVMMLFIGLAIVISLVTVVIAHLSWRGWIAAVRGVLRGDIFSPLKKEETDPEVRPLVSDLRAVLHEMNLERRERSGSTQMWTPGKLRSFLHDELAGDEILVVSNREPYIHNTTPEGIAVQRPASGLVTAVEPIVRACSGTWIAHGAGTADRETVDSKDHVPVPPEDPSFTLRRIWLSEAEEKGYYYGFSNEGLWPLCHIAHVRPVFRSADWEHYVAINQRFADAVVKEAHTEDPVVLVQDYHFALLPRMIYQQLPRATIITFWHIPWPNPESFGICPWREEILEGLLGSTILGFHTPFHCKNFIETVDRYLETRIEHEASTISYGGKMTQVEDYPISIAWPQDRDMESLQGIAETRRDIRASLGLPENHLLGLGLDRLDYTKGIIERFQAVERMLELYPAMVGRFTLLQIAAPSRSSLPEYQNFDTQVRELVTRINGRYPDAPCPPIMLNVAHHSTAAVNRHYRASDVCLVTSLHDGMNLVAKEFVAQRDDERGVLLLSQFTGAARELHEALIVNPYHIDQTANELYRALTMPEVEQRERMRSMRAQVKDFNVYRWAGRMLLDAARMRRRERILAKIQSHRQTSQWRRG